MVTVLQPDSPFPASTRCAAPAPTTAKAPVGASARASGASASGAGSNPDDQLVPPSVLRARGEKRKRNEGRKPTVTAPAGDAATAMPPLSATPGGVRNVHVVLAEGWRNNSQKVFARSPRSPIGSTTEATAGVVTPEASERPGTVAAPARGAAVTPAARATAVTPVSAPHTAAPRPRCLTNS